MLALHDGRTDALEVSPNLWAGVGLVRGGAGHGARRQPRGGRRPDRRVPRARHRRVHPLRLSAPRGGLPRRRGRAAGAARARPGGRAPAGARVSAVVALSGNPRRGSRTAAFATAAAEAVAELLGDDAGAPLTLDLADPDRSPDELRETIASASVVVVASPTFKGTLYGPAQAAARRLRPRRARGRRRGPADGPRARRRTRWRSTCTCARCCSSSGPRALPRRSSRPRPTSPSRRRCSTPGQRARAGRCARCTPPG